MKFGIISLLFFVYSSFSQTLYFPPVVGNVWENLSIQQLNWCDDEVDELYQYLDKNNSKAFILLKDGKIVLEKYFGSFTQDSIWYWASAGKSLTALLVGIAQEEKSLNINDKTSKFLGEGWTNCPLEKENLITIKHQLTMTTGLSDLVADPYCTQKQCLEYLKDAGSRWSYHNAPYTLLDNVIEKATGQNLNSFVTNRLLTKTGISGAFIKSGFNNVFISKPRVMARYGLLILAKANWNGVPILNDKNYFNQMVSTSQSLNPSYGYLWWLNGKSSFMVPGFQIVFPGPLCKPGPNDLICALGKNGQMINIVPSQNLVWIRMGNALEGGEVPFRLNDTVWSYLNKIICTPTKVNEYEQGFDETRIYQEHKGGQIKIVRIPLGSSVNVYNVIGRRVFQQTTKLNEILIPNLQRGIYIIELKNSIGPSICKKIIVY